ncbi:MAG: HEAT repeat domain-containing protein [Planctomycetota bacterium]|jgi:hypothetical protein|nr:HEAT repeat domain-containing protein [Planctomycetota bacterium]
MSSSGIQKTFRELTSLPKELVLEMIQAALEEEDVDILDEAVSALLAPRFRDQMESVIAHFDQLSPAVRDRVLKHGELLTGAIRRSYFSFPLETRRLTLEILTSMKGAESVDLLLRVIRDPDPDLAQQALVWVQHEVQRLSAALGEGEKPIVRMKKRQELSRSIEQILGGEDPGIFSVLIELLLVLMPESEWVLRRILSRLSSDSPDQPAAQVLLDQLKSTMTRGHLRFVLILLGDRTLSELAKGILVGRFSERAFQRALLEIMSEHRVPEVSQWMERTDQLPWIEVLMRLGGQFDGAGASVLLSAGLTFCKEAEDRVGLARAFHRHDSRDVQIQVIELCSDLPVTVAQEILQGYLASESEEVVLWAAETLLEIDVPDKMDILAPLSGSPHERVRNLVNRQLAQYSFKSFLDTGSGMGVDTRKMVARTIEKLDAGIVDEIIDDLDNLPSDRKIQALLFLDNLDQASRAQDALGQIMDDPSQHVRATVCTLLGHIKNVEAVKDLLRCLGDPDGRVLANSIEALDALNNPHVASVLLPFVRHRNSRVRGNALRALLRLGNHVVEPFVVEMLQSGDERMRLSGVWVIRQVGMRGYRDVLHAMSLSDVSDRVRSRAAQAILQLDTKRSASEQTPTAERDEKK